ncbi:hypothetical protein FJ434_20455 [Mesorhizobium sp. B2-5-13]|uniref:hypothetical protein n=1 Tax=unclassified Mesorhizobium TaxID=325217 RepID=UPI00112BFA52|nr:MULTISPECIES: hypothetical protein [unclassified Mesorhizobium]TPJ81878.1 hypothetical protein FJ434_20455 [Mesorhizobium sp. B2-5-13]TPK45908.1 hypothetical protein FJ560_20230 [Mesorhizobium sp. B2-5-5]
MEILPRPVGHEDRTGPAFWVDEAIWGHRLHDEQSPWLILLEFLGVLRSESLAGRALTEVEFNKLSYRPQTQLRLRNVIFNNPYLLTIGAERLSDDAAWAKWLELMQQNAGGLDDRDFSYLRHRFDSFEDFSAVVGFLQSSAIEGTSNKRWSSKFVFPFGPNALYEDAAVTASGVSTDRRFFARTGEVLYLMLSRAKRAADLRDRLVGKLFEQPTVYDRLVGALQGEAQLAENDRPGSYLPCSAHPIFDQMAEDWIAILDSPISVFDALPHLVTITGLNLIRYQLERARELLDAVPITMVCEIVSPRKTVVRDLAADSFQANNALPGLAIEHYIRSAENSHDWQAALASDDALLSAAEVLARQFDWPDPDELSSDLTNPGVLLDELVSRAKIRHAQHVGKVHSTWARQIGLSSRRSSRRVRYAPTDRLLKTLVVCCVPERLEFKDFLRELNDRYGLVIGDHQAASIIGAGKADQEDFSDNARRLEERLISLGLLNRLSDSAAYVENPFRREVRA